MDIPEVGRFAVIQDPQGAFFGIIKLNQPPPA
jgi:predicted enzyme related to lactoylglutathione lyase